MADGSNAEQLLPYNKIKLAFEGVQVIVIFLVMMFAAMMFADIASASNNLDAARYKDTKYDCSSQAYKDAVASGSSVGCEDLDFDAVDAGQAYSEEMCGAQSACAQEADESFKKGAAQGTDANDMPILNSRKFWTDGSGHLHGSLFPSDDMHDPDGFRCTICDASWDPNKEGGSWVRNDCKRCDIETSWKFSLSHGQRRRLEEEESPTETEADEKCKARGASKLLKDADGKKLKCKCDDGKRLEYTSTDECKTQSGDKKTQGATNGASAGPWAAKVRVPSGSGPRNDPEVWKKNGKDGVSKNENIHMTVPGFMLLSNADETQMSSCQAHYNSNLLLGWGKNKVEVAKVNISYIQTGKTFGTKSFQTSLSSTSGGCPASKSYKGQCTFITEKDWDVYLSDKNQLDKWGGYQSSHMFAFASGFLPIWFLLKVVSMDPEVFDMVCDKIFCGKCKLRANDSPNPEEKKKGHMAGLLDLAVLPEKAQPLIQMFMNYFRFKIAANTLLWPLTTLGINEACGQHLFTALPGLTFYVVLSWVAALDLLYTIAVYFVTACCQDKKKCEGIKTFLAIPWVITTMVAFFGFILTLVKSGITVVFGFNIDIGFKFELSAQWGMFTLLYFVLSTMEFVNFVVNVSKHLLTAIGFCEAQKPKGDTEAPPNSE